MPLDHGPEFALSFTTDAVHLRQRKLTAGQDSGWRDLGQVAFTAPDFQVELAALRASALRAGSAGDGDDHSSLPVLLLIPQEQILYTSLAVPAGPQRDQAVGQALEGLTPYAIDELSFDWVDEGGDVRVAAVARQTLIEALEFAQRHGFSGAGFSALPQGGDYPNRPVFHLQDAEADTPDLMDPDNMLDPLPAPENISDDPAPSDAFDTLSVLHGDEASDSDPAEEGFADRAPAPVPDPEGDSVLGSHEEDGFADPHQDRPAISAESVEEEEEEADQPAFMGAVDQSAPPKPATAQPPAPVAKPVTASPGKLVAAPRHDKAVAQPLVQPAALQVTADAAPVVVRHATPQVGGADRQAVRKAGKVAAPRQGRKMGGQRGGLIELVAMLGALVIGLLLIWAFFVPRDNPAQQMGQDIAGANLAEAVDPTPAVVEPQKDPAPEQVIAPPLTDQQAATEAPAEVESAGAPSASSEALAGLPDVADVTVPTPPALTQIEQALIVAAATEPVEAVAAQPLPPAENATRLAEAAAAEDAARKTAAEQAAALEAARMALAAEEASRAQIAATQPANTVLASSEQAKPAPTPPAARLTSSARPLSAPRRASAAPRVDPAPTIPSSPLPFEAARRPAVTPAGTRPPSRPAAARPAAPSTTSEPAQAPAAQVAPPVAPSQPVVSTLRSSSRPPARPEGSASDSLSDQPLSADEQEHIRQMLKGFGQKSAWLPEPAKRQAGLDLQDEAYRVADLRPTRRPAKVEAKARQGGVSSVAVEDAVRAAAANAPPDRPAGLPDNSSASTLPARNSGGLLHVSARPAARPGSGKSASTSGVDAALTEAVSSAAALPSALPGGGVALTALTSSRLPPRRSGQAAAGVETAALAASPQVSEAAEQAERRRLDEQLQSQAEARIRARAAADAAAEATARAEAEARAKAQVAAEERAAAAKKQSYVPQEMDNEPEVAKAVARGPTAATVASAATEKRGLNMGRTTIIGIIGAGQASRALIRLRNGKIVTVRLGDKIDGGVITSIGDGRVRYAKAGRTHELRLLDGR